MIIQSEMIVYDISKNQNIYDDHWAFLVGRIEYFKMSYFFGGRHL